MDVLNLRTHFRGRHQILSGVDVASVTFATADQNAQALFGAGANHSISGRLDGDGFVAADRTH